MVFAFCSVEIYYLGFWAVWSDGFSPFSLAEGNDFCFKNGQKPKVFPFCRAKFGILCRIFGFLRDFGGRIIALLFKLKLPLTELAFNSACL